MKQKLKGAQTGHSLLKRKSEALTKRFRDIVKKIDDVCVIVRSRCEQALNPLHALAPQEFRRY